MDLRRKTEPYIYALNKHELSFVAFTTDSAGAFLLKKILCMGHATCSNPSRR